MTHKGNPWKGNIWTFGRATCGGELLFLLPPTFNKLPWQAPAIFCENFCFFYCHWNQLCDGTWPTRVGKLLCDKLLPLLTVELNNCIWSNPGIPIFFCCEAEPTKFDQLCRTGGLGRATLLRSPVCDKLLTVATLDFSQVSQPTCFWHSWQMENLSQWSSQIWALWLAIACATQYHLPTGHSNYRWLTRWASTHIQSNWLGSDQFLLCSKIKRLQKKSSDKNTKSLSARMPSLVKWHSPNAVTDDSLLAAEMKLHTLQIAWNQAFL